MTLATLFPSLEVVGLIPRLQVLQLELDAALEVHFANLMALSYAGPGHKDYFDLDVACLGSSEEVWEAMKAFHLEKRIVEGKT